MKYSIKNKKQRNKNTRSSIKSRSRRRRANKKGGCGCRQNGGSSGPSNLSSLSPANYYQYYNVGNDPKMNMVSTSTPSNVQGGSLQKKNSSNKKQNKKQNKNKKTKKMTGGISAADMVSSFGTPQLVSNVTSYLVGNNAVSPPDYLQSTMSLNQGSSNVPYVSPGMKYYV